MPEQPSARPRSADRSRFSGLTKMAIDGAHSGIDENTSEDNNLTLLHNLIVALAARELSIPGLDNRSRGRHLPPKQSARRISNLERRPLKSSVVNNSLLMGARAQHDEYPPARSRSGNTVIPALLGLSEIEKPSGRRFLEAIVVGYEVGARIDSAPASGPYQMDSGPRAYLVRSPPPQLVQPCSA